MSNIPFSDKDVQILRRLAHRLAVCAHDPINEKKVKLWQKHNDLETDEPMVIISPEGSYGELITLDDMECENELARGWEWYLRTQIYWAEVLKDDYVVEPILPLGYACTDDGWGVERKTISNGVSYIIDAAIRDYEEDFPKLHFPKLKIDWDKTNEMIELGKKVFGDTLDVKLYAQWWWSMGLSNDYIHLRGLENFMVDFIDEPEWVHRMYDFLCQGTLEKLDFLEENGLLFQNTTNKFIGSGGFGNTNQIPTKAPGEKILTSDMWGFCESQETVSMNPDMYGEFIFPHHKRIMERFALNCFGCCEPFDPLWKYIKQLPNLRRVSVSPWADWTKVPEYLGKDYIASVKPIPTPLASANMNEDVVRKDCRRAVEETKGGICEFIMKDTHTMGHNPRNASRWVEIMREEIDRVYG